MDNINKRKKSISKTIAKFTNRIARSLVSANSSDARALRDALLVLNQAQSVVDLHEKEAIALFSTAKILAKSGGEDEA